jgi:two-component system sensor histidine kinase KdpD
MEDVYKRMTPEEALKIAGSTHNRGKLKIFIGYAPGVGKTYTMLNEGNRRMQRGEDIVIGYTEAHGRAETDKQISNTPVIPRKKIEYGGHAMEEMDTDAIIKRHPTTVLVDEMAHTNVPGSKYLKRYEDISKILDAGINVITTLNIQHLESLNDTIQQITGVVVRETIPDIIVESADEVVAVDVSVEALLNRLKRGDVYKKEQIDSALRNFFREGNLNALREIALRQTAQEVDEELEEYMKAHGIEDAWQTVERIMVCISPSLNAKKLIRRAALIARRYRAEWFAVAVENTSFFAAKWTQKEKQELDANFKLASQLGAKTVVLSGRSISIELSKFSKEKHVTQIVIGHSEKSIFQSFFTGTTTSQLLQMTKNIAIHVVPTRDEMTGVSGGMQWLEPVLASERNMNDYWKAFMTFLVITALNFLVLPYIGYQTAGFIYLLAVLVLSLFVSIVPIILFAMVSAFAWDFFFIPPFGTLTIAHKNDIIMCIAFVFTSVITGYLTSKIRKDEKLLSLREARTDTMYRIVSVIAGAKDRHSAIVDVKDEIEAVFPGKCQIFIRNDKTKFEDILRKGIANDEKELSVAMWAFEKGRAAGWTSDTLASAKSLYIPLRGPSETVGILSYTPAHEKELSLDEVNMLFAVVNQLSIFIERELFREQALEAQEIRDSERLQQTLLDSVSHEIRTPITAIVGIASALQDGNISGDAAKRAELARDLKESSDRLDNIVTNILDMSRISSGTLSLKKEWNDINDVINVSTHRLEEKLAKHKISIEIEDGIPLINIDFYLFEQAISNILSNTATYTPDGAEIKIKASKHRDKLSLVISDNGPGIPQDELPFIFDKFYRVKGSMPGGTGLGLAITKSVIEAHKGKIEARNTEKRGLEIKITIPIEKQPIMKEMPGE